MGMTAFQARVRAMGGKVDTELSRLVTYINDAVVPEVRRSSAAGLRVAAGQLGRLAEHLDRPPARRATAARAYSGDAAQGRGL